MLEGDFGKLLLVLCQALVLCVYERLSKIMN